MDPVELTQTQVRGGYGQNRVDVSPPSGSTKSDPYSCLCNFYQAVNLNLANGHSGAAPSNKGHEESIS